MIMAERGDVDRIRQLLGEHRNGLTIDEVSRHLGINRSTASKYLNALVSSGTATIRKLGPAKLFYIRELVPLHQLLNFTSDGIVIVDSGFEIHFANNPILSLFNLDERSLIGSVIFNTPLSALWDEEVKRAFEESRIRQEIEMEGTINVRGTVMGVQKKVIPVRFESGSTGYCFVCRFGEGTGGGTVTCETSGISDTALFSQFYQLSALLRRHSMNRVTLALEILKKISDNRTSPRFPELAEDQEQVLKSLLLHTRTFDEFLGDTPPELRWNPLEEIVGTALSLVRLSHVRFFSDIRGVDLLADQSICRVFQALLENSIVHGQKVTSIRITARESPEGLTITCEDDGIGIPENEKAALFEWGRGPRRAHSLFICRQVLAASGMSLRETGEYGRGARFEIQVPPGKYRLRSDYTAGRGTVSPS